MIKVNDKVIELSDGKGSDKIGCTISPKKISRITTYGDGCAIYQPNGQVMCYYQEKHDLSEIYQAIKDAGHDNFIFVRGVIFNLDQIEKIESFNCDIYNEYGVIVVPKGTLGTYLFDCENEEEVISLTEKLDAYHEEYEELNSGLNK